LVRPPFGVELKSKSRSRLLHQESGAGALDLLGDLAVDVGGHTCHAAGKDLAGLGGELLEEVGVLEVDRIGGDVETTAGHGAVGLAEVAATLRGLGCAHDEKLMRVSNALRALVTWSRGGGCGA